MFLTQSRDQVQLLPVSDPDPCFWRQVTLASDSCQLCVVAMSPEDHTRTVFAATSELERIAQESQITHVALLSPSRVNSTDHWALDPIAEIWRCAATLPGEQICQGWTYVLADGRELLDCYGLDAMFEFRRTTLTYSTQAHETASAESAH